jgi:hypothetical protein
MIDNGSITLDNSIYCEIASIAGIGYLAIFQNLYSDLNGVKSSPTST